MSTPDVDYFGLAAEQARNYRDSILTRRRHDIHLASTVVVTPTILGPDWKTRVPCGSEEYPRCVADQFVAGTLTITAIDDERTVREFKPGMWADCTVFGPDGHIAYSWRV